MQISSDGRQELALEQQLSQHMLLSLRILHMDLHALCDAIEREIGENPLLEFAETWRPGGRTLDIAALSAAPNVLRLEDELMSQLREAFRDAASLRIGAQIVAGIDERGFLALPLQTIARECQASVDDVKCVLKRMRRFDPPGVAARTLRECLLIQLLRADSRDRCAEYIVRNCLAELATQNFAAIAQSSGFSLEDVRAAVETIRALNPRPAAAYGAGTAAIAIPEIRFYQNDEGKAASVLINQPPGLRVVPAYREYLKSNDETLRSYAREKLKRARAIQSSIELRGTTLSRVADCIAAKQEAHILRGEAPVALTLAELAADLGLHVSTISRCVTERYFTLNGGVYALKSLFPARLGGDASSAQAKALMRLWLSEEDKTKPLSDSAIAGRLAEQNIQVSRRAIAKYRMQMGIAAASERKKR